MEGWKIESLIKWQASDQWSEENFLHSTVLELSSKTGTPFQLIWFYSMFINSAFLESKIKGSKGKQWNLQANVSNQV